MEFQEDEEVMKLAAEVTPTEDSELAVVRIDLSMPEILEIHDYMVTTL